MIDLTGVTPHQNLITLLVKKREIQARIANREPIAVERYTDQLDNAKQLSEREVAAGAIDHDTKLLREVEAALERIRTGEYGVCVRCEETISERRLAAVPWAALCRECQQVAEDERAAAGVVCGGLGA